MIRRPPPPPPRRHWHVGLFAASLLWGMSAPALAQSPPSPHGDMVEVHGRLARYILNPQGLAQCLVVNSAATYSLTGSGNVDGVTLQPSAQIALPAGSATRIVHLVSPGDAVTIRGTRLADDGPITARMVVNDATGKLIATDAPQPLDEISHIRLQLHGPAGDLNGVVLDDGTIIRLPPEDALRHAAILAIGLPLYASGDWVASPLGTMINAHRIGPSRQAMIEVVATR